MTLQQNQSEAIAFIQAIRADIPEDAERLIWEVEAKVDHRTYFGYYPDKSKSFAWMSDGRTEYFLYNSQGFYIANFRVKSWKQ